MKKLILSIVAMLTLATSAFAQIGSLASDLVFTPIVPCRIVDTRNAGAGGAILGGSPTTPNPRVFKGWAASYTAQGGSPTNCGLPQTSNIAALSVNLVVVGTAGDGWIAAYPVGATLPVVSNLNYGAGAVLANSAILKINQTTNDWNLFSTQTTHFVADVTGYYSKPVAGPLECTYSTYETFSVPAAYNGFHYTAPACSAGYSAVSAICENNNAGIVFNGSGIYAGGNTSYCFWRNTTAGALSVSQSNTCCRIPGR